MREIVPKGGTFKIDLRELAWPFDHLKRKQQGAMNEAKNEPLPGRESVGTLILG
jgi:hypothetical protein